MLKDLFDFVPDMDGDGDHDLMDYLLFEDMMEEPDAEDKDSRWDDDDEDDEDDEWDEDEDWDDDEEADDENVLFTISISFGFGDD